ncbi:MAG: hypothetical protein CMH83_14095 [Nocardioides sp.]|nr:hypothetical protein [Nocardioides sp.]
MPDPRPDEQQPAHEPDADLGVRSDAPLDASEPADVEQTQPIAATPAGPARPSEQPAASTPRWGPPTGPVPGRPFGPWHDYGREGRRPPGPDVAGPATLPMPVGPRHSSRPERPPRPPRPRGTRRRTLAVLALALLLGLLGGFAGAGIWDTVDGPEIAGPYEGGLDDVDLAELPPVEVGGVAAVAEALLPSTVQISAQLGGIAGEATGSGFVLDEQQHVITNNHVVADAAESGGTIEVVDADGETYPAAVVGRSPTYDLAVLQLEGSDLEPAALGRSETLRVGDGVVAIGSPLGLSSTVTAGIVSALKRPVTTGNPGDDSSYINAIQTDAAINPGNSGGPLVNLRGQVIGVNSAIATNGGGSISGEAGNIGVGFAIPVEQVRITADQILKTGEAQYPVIGATVNTGQSTDGATIAEIDEGTPAADAGLEVGDVVVEVDGERVTDGISLIVSIRSHQPGEVVEFVYRRAGQEQTTDIQLGSKVG